MAQTWCPVKIDPGALLKGRRAAARPTWSRAVAGLAARHFGLTALGARGGLRAAWLLRAVPLGSRGLDLLTDLLHRLAPSLVPHLTPGLALPRPAPRPPPAVDDAAAGARSVVYFPTCLPRIPGPEPGQTMVPPARAALESLRWAGFTARYPDGLLGLCCGMPFASKAFSEAAREVAAKTAEALWRASHEGRDPVVTDASPCAGTLNDLALAFLRESGRSVRVFDFPSFWPR